MKRTAVLIGVIVLVIFARNYFLSQEDTRELPPVQTQATTTSIVPKTEKIPSKTSEASSPIPPYRILDMGKNITPDSIFVLVNNERAAAAIRPLNRSAALDAVAQAKLDDMLSRDYFAHNTPDGQPTWIWFDKQGYQYLKAGENLARNFDTPAETVEGWVESPTHLENILNKDFTETGVAVSGSTVVQEFATPK